MFLNYPNWNTPLVKLERESKKFNCKIYAKLELVNPTGSHKDRESVVVILDMKRKGFNSLACASSGNAAISFSAYAYMAGFKAHLFIGSDTPDEKIRLIEAFHPVIHKVEGDYLNAVKALKNFVKNKHIYNANAGACPERLIGNTYIGIEIAAIKPTVVICPTNNGTHFVGVGKGILSRGIKARMIAAIAPKTNIAHSIKGFYKLEEPKISELIDKTKGEIIEVSDSEIKEACISLAKQGIIAEPASAASIAALNHLTLTKNDKVCATITSSGLKFPDLIKKTLNSEEIKNFK